MNLGIFLPGVMCCVAFGLGCMNYANKQKQEEREGETTRVSVVELSNRSLSDTIDSDAQWHTVQEETPAALDESADLLDWETAKKMLKKDWPEIVGTDIGSRAGGSRDAFYVEVRDFPKTWEDHPVFLTTFSVTVKRERDEFPICVDRRTEKLYIYVKRQWLDYGAWCEDNLPRYEATFTGRAARDGSAGGGRGGARGGGGRGGGRGGGGRG